MKVGRILAAIGVVGVIAAGTGMVCYQSGKDAMQARLTALQDEIDSLRAGERDAAVTRRVSKQMEDIAYQQKSISDEQRDRAEEQSTLAIQMRDKAEQESHAARQAEEKAVASADEAQKQRELAQQQQKEAENQRDQATRAKSLSDTLNYRSIGRAMGNCITDGLSPEVTNLLSYGSWMYLKRYKGNTYNPTTFKWLEQQSGELVSNRLSNRSAINAMATLPSQQGCVAVTNYGEVVEWKKGQLRTILHDKKYDFRAVGVDGQGNAYALNVNGPLLKVNLSSSKQEIIGVPADKYIDLLPMDDNKLIVVGKKSISWLNLSTGQVDRTVSLKKELSTACVRQNEVWLFYANGNSKGYDVMDASGNIKVCQLPTEKTHVTAATYDDRLGCFVLGFEDGSLTIMNRYLRLISSFASHTSRVRRLAINGGVLLSSGYDRKLCVWYMLGFQLPSGCSFMDEMRSPTPLSKPKNNGLGTEWVPSVDYTYSSWPLALTSSNSNTRFWLGTGDGEMVSMDADVDEMASLVKNKLTRNFTQSEWEGFVGVNVPYEKFK